MKLMCKFLIVVLSFLSFPAFALLSEDEVKTAKSSGKVLLSSSGSKCHSVDSPSYKNLKNVLAKFNTLKDCMKTSGAELPKNMVGYDQALRLISEKIDEAEDKKIDAIKNNKPDEAVAAAKEQEELKDKKEELNKKKEELNNFTGLRFGYGVAFTHIREKYMEDVQIQNGTVFVKKSVSNRGSFMLESHVFFQGNTWERWGVGPFIALSLADTEGGSPFSAYGGGVMFGFKEREGDGSWNIGLGYYVNTEFRELRNGVTDGMTTTETDPENLIVERDRDGFMIMVSSTW